MTFNVAHIKEKLAGLHEGNEALMVVDGCCAICHGKMGMFENLYVKCLANGNHVGQFFYPYHPEMDGVWKVPPVKMVDLGECSAEVDDFGEPMTAKGFDKRDALKLAVNSCMKIPKSFLPAIPEPRSAFGRMMKKKIEDLKKVS